MVCLTHFTSEQRVEYCNFKEHTSENKLLVAASAGNQNYTNNTHQNTMINGSKMAKSFGKNPGNWLRLSSTKKFLAALSEAKCISPDELIQIVKQNGNGPEKGVWMHEEAALEFARWLSPSFAIWNNRRTQELLLTGNTNMRGEEGLPTVALNLLAIQVEWLDDAMHEQLRKAGYHDAVLQSRTLIPTTVIAKELGMSATALNKFLHDKKIIYKTNAHWVLYAGYQGKGYTGTKTALYVDSGGRYQSNIHTYWTERGREFIHSLLKEVKQIA